VPVDEELAAPRVPEPQSFDGIAEQRRRKPIQSSSLRLEALPAHVDHQPLAAAVRAAVVLRAHVQRHLHDPAAVGAGRRLAVEWRRRGGDHRRVGWRRQRDGGHGCGVVGEERAGDGRRRRRRVGVVDAGGRVAGETVCAALLRLILTAPHRNIG